MATGEANAQSELAAERGRTAAVVGGGAVAVIGMLLFAGALSPWAAFVSAAAISAIGFLFLGMSDASADSNQDGATSHEKRPPQAHDKPAEVLEVLPEPVLVISADGRVEAANAAARAAFALTRPGASLTSVVRAPSVLDAVDDVCLSGEPQSVAYRTMAPRERHMRAYVTAFGERSEGKYGAVIALHDETAIKRAERMRADFLADASHELRTPLASMALCVDTLRGHAREDPAARERFFTIMRQQSAHMRRLIDDLLALSRIELDEHVPPRQRVDLAVVAADVIDSLAPLATERDVRIELERDDAIAMVLGEREQLIQVVQNLVDNALKYSPSGGRVIVSIGCHASSAEASHPTRPMAPDAGRMAIVAPGEAERASYAWLRVRDFGPGIASRHLPRLSERFFRVEESEGKKKSGTGLGLAIVKHIMSRHRGGFVVESAPGSGSMFSIYVPHTPDAARLSPPSARGTRAA